MSKFLTFLMTFLVLGLTPRQAKAQLEAGNYSFSAFSGTYTAIAGTPTPNIQVDTKLGDKLPIGFTFAFEGISYDTVRASSNGFLSFNYTSGSTNSGTTNDLDFVTTAIRPLVAPLWDDLDGGAVGGSSASYETSGVAPNRVFTFQWSAWEWRYNANDSVISFQVKLYETTNVIEFIYEQGTAPVSSGTASIGISGAATGSGNFLSLDGSGPAPNASWTTETTTISTKPATGQVYQFTPPVFHPLDMSAIGIIPPVFDGCYTNAETVAVIVKNSGSATIDFAVDNATVEAIVTGSNPATLNVTLTSGTLASLDQDTFIVSSTYDMTASGNYDFQGNITVVGDPKSTNDTMVGLESITVPAAAIALPVSVDFAGYTGSNLSTLFPGWGVADGFPFPTGSTSDWEEQDDLDFVGNTNIRINLYTNTHEDWIVGPKMMAILGTQLSYDVAVTNWDDVTTTDSMGLDDRLYVMLTQDCGFSWTIVDSVWRGDTLPITLTNRKVDLSSYAGQEIQLAFFATGGTVNDPEDYDLHLDNIFIDQLSFKLLSPADGSRLLVEGNANNTVDAVWEEDLWLPAPVTYRWYADTVGGDFSNPYIILPSNTAGADTVLTLDYVTIDGFLDNLGLAVGDSIDLIWTVRAFSGADSIEASETFGLRLIRGLILQNFDLIAPATGTALTVEGNQNQEVIARWEESVKGADYFWALETAIGLPLTTRSTGADTSLTISYTDIDVLLNTAGIAIGNVINLRWTVGAVVGDDTTFASNGYFTLDLTRGALTNDFNLLTLANGSAVTIEGDPTQAFVSTWEDAQVNGDGDITYTWLLDEATGDFSTPLVTAASDNTGIDEVFTMTYGEVANMLTTNGIAMGATLNAKWTVVTNFGDTAVGPFTIDLTRGIITGITENTGTKQIAIYPNPSNGTFQLVLDQLSSERIKLEIRDVNGKVMFEDQLNGHTSNLTRTYHIEGLKNGVYFLNISQGRTKDTRRLVIQN
jgi:hypothetical protein